jgi:hypothetical protein
MGDITSIREGVEKATTSPSERKPGETKKKKHKLLM